MRAVRHHGAFTNAGQPNLSSRVAPPSSEVGAGFGQPSKFVRAVYTLATSNYFGVSSTHPRRSVHDPHTGTETDIQLRQTSMATGTMVAAMNVLKVWPEASGIMPIRTRPEPRTSTATADHSYNVCRARRSV
jgi:hypothetical protein